jgi:DNA repair protein RadA/Sms
VDPWVNWRAEPSSIPAPSQAVPITEIEARRFERISTGFAGFDRVLGGGAALGGAVLLGGGPGAGKSTLLLQALANVARGGAPCLYMTSPSESSAEQLRTRAIEIGASVPGLFVLADGDLSLLPGEIERVQPAIVVVDSVQTVYLPDVDSPPGGMAQVRESALVLVERCKAAGFSLFLVCHVTKDVTIAGPKSLEHFVDTVLFFGEVVSPRVARSSRRRLWCEGKNRLGSAHEYAFFDMGAKGLAEVEVPSEEERDDGDPG